MRGSRFKTRLIVLKLNSQLTIVARKNEKGIARSPTFPIHFVCDRYPKVSQKKKKKLHTPKHNL